ncbi:hypothetical protein C4579_03120 [Candidatus Microgenomates bacterium]|nr:MAG: hypothetical protein C4579_03120 [Candidatus Microgenomates bacterium]
MKKRYALIILLLTFSLLVLPTQVRAQMMGVDNQLATSETEHANLDEVLADLLAKYNVTSVQDLDCNELTDDDFESVGEGWMSLMHPETEVHERMDAMMGGEGSQSLRQAHIQMGSNYLGCSPAGYRNGMGMMGGGMMTGNGMMGNAMMGTDVAGIPSYQFTNARQSIGLTSHMALVNLNLLLLSALLVILIRYFWIRGSK